MNHLLIRQGRLLDPASRTDRIADLMIENGHIAGIDLPDFSADQVLDAHNAWIIPGFIDLAARLREPGQEHKATIASECRAAVRSGITTLCVQPDTTPPVDTPADVRLLQQKSGLAGGARIAVIGALTQGLEGKHLSEMAALIAAGCAGIGNASRPISNLLVLRHALEYAAGLGITVFAQPMESTLSRGGCAHEGPIANRLGLPGIPVAAETAALGQWLALVEETGARVHFGRLSSAAGVRLIARAHADSLPVSADIAAHQLLLTEMDIADFNPQCHVLPPLRSTHDRDTLREAVSTGVIAAICSDHQPHEIDAKLAPFAETEPGISALETLLGLGLRLVDEGCLDPLSLVDRLSCAPAKILGLNRGTLKIGKPADLCIIDPDKEWTVRPERFASRGQNTPFAGWLLRGRVLYTLIEGRIVYSLQDADNG